MSTAEKAKGKELPQIGNFREVGEENQNPINSEKPPVDTFEDLDFQEAETGQFQFFSLINEGDKLTFTVEQDCEGDNENDRTKAPEWLPGSVATKCYVVRTYPDRQRGILSKFYTVDVAIKKYGIGHNVVYRVTRGKKEGEKQTDFVNFNVKVAHIK